MSDEVLDRQQRTTPTGTSPEKPAIRPYRPTATVKSIDPDAIVERDGISPF